MVDIDIKKTAVRPLPPAAARELGGKLEEGALTLYRSAKFVRRGEGKDVPRAQVTLPLLWLGSLPANFNHVALSSPLIEIAAGSPVGGNPCEC